MAKRATQATQDAKAAKLRATQATKARRAKEQAAKEGAAEFEQLSTKRASGAAVMQAFPMKRKEPGALKAECFYHGVLDFWSDTVSFFADGEITPAGRLTTMEELLGRALPSFLEGTIPLITTRLETPGCIYEHQYVSKAGESRSVVLVGISENCREL